MTFIFFYGLEVQRNYLWNCPKPFSLFDRLHLTWIKEPKTKLIDWPAPLIFLTPILILTLFPPTSWIKRRALYVLPVRKDFLRIIFVIIFLIFSYLCLKGEKAEGKDVRLLRRENILGDISKILASLNVFEELQVVWYSGQLIPKDTDTWIGKWCAWAISADTTNSFVVTHFFDLGRCLVVKSKSSEVM